jgi:hypothetical protein
MNACQCERAKIALRKLDSQKSIKKFKLGEHFENVRLSILLRMPYTVIKKHNNCCMSVCNENGLVRMEFPDEYIPIRRFLQRSDSPTFAEWLQDFHQDKCERYQSDPIRFKFGMNTSFTFTDECQRLMDEYDSFCWCRSEEMRRFYLSSLLADADIDSMSE